MRLFLIFILCWSFSAVSWSQSTFLKRHSDDYFMLERYDALRGRHSDTLLTALNPATQLDAVRFLEQLQHDYELKGDQRELTNILQLISVNSEWAANGDASIDSKKPIFKTFYKKKSDCIHIVNKDYAIILNPVIYYMQSIESGNTAQQLFLNSKGIEVRGNIGRHIGFYSMFSDNQERGPLHHQNYVLAHQAVPGATYYKDFKPQKAGHAQDYLLATGYIDASVIKDKMNLSFGSNRFQLGDGYRSLLLSDFGSNYLFLRLNTRLGRLNYQNLFMELTPQYTRGADQLLPRKYAAIHQLSMNLGKRWNVGLYESVVFGRKDFFDFQYLNPIIFYRSVEQTKGSPDNAMIGINIKLNTSFHTVFYGQVLIDEFNFSRIKANNGWWGNKYALQAGCKVADIFGIRNLLLQPEFDLIRPFTYTHNDSVAEFSHYNQSLAHPYGANLVELSLNIHYKAGKKSYFTWCSFYNKQGRDTLSNTTFGGNIFKPNSNPHSEFGIRMFNGYPSTVLYSNLCYSYALRTNLMIDVSAGFRKETATHTPNLSYQSAQCSIGLRLNAERRQYDY